MLEARYSEYSTPVDTSLHKHEKGKLPVIEQFLAKSTMELVLYDVVDFNRLVRCVCSLVEGALSGLVHFCKGKHASCCSWINSGRLLFEVRT